ncbi:MAG: hypothetical protein PWP08_1536 [Methanofollis sp.]|nr:hypothetical protein [Methanofollis sp.]
MDYFDLISISTRNSAIMNPTTPGKLAGAGEMARLTAGEQVIEFGCGYGTILALWGERFGIFGRGIDIRKDACIRAEETLLRAGLSERITISCADLRTEIPDRGYDLAVCVGSSHIWGGFSASLSAMAEWLAPEGRIVIGERYWAKESVPPSFSREWPEVLTEYEIFSWARDAGFEIRGVFRASHDDWDAYESSNWGGLLAWLEEHPADPGADEVREYLRRIQDEYAGYGREYMGFALYVLVPS